MFANQSINIYVFVFLWLISNVLLIPGGFLVVYFNQFSNVNCSMLMLFIPGGNVYQLMMCSF